MKHHNKTNLMTTIPFSIIMFILIGSGTKHITCFDFSLYQEYRRNGNLDLSLSWQIVSNTVNIYHKKENNFLCFIVFLIFILTYILCVLKFIYFCIIHKLKKSLSEIDKPTRKIFFYFTGSSISDKDIQRYSKTQQFLLFSL